MKIMCLTAYSSCSRYVCMSLYVSRLCRVLCYNAGRKDGSLLGEPEREYNDDTLGRVFAITYSETGK